MAAKKDTTNLIPDDPNSPVPTNQQIIDQAIRNVFKALKSKQDGKFSLDVLKAIAWKTGADQTKGIDPVITITFSDSPKTREELEGVNRFANPITDTGLVEPTAYIPDVEIEITPEDLEPDQSERFDF